MRSMITILIAVMLLSVAATAELQNVELDGKITIRMNYLDLQNDVTKTYAEQRTLLGVKADFTDDVSAYIQFDNYSIWGEDFRSMSWESGYDDRATIEGAREDDWAEVEVYQSYINVNDMWGTPLDLRIGRQELVFGSEWLLGNNDTGYRAYGLSFDAIRVDYATDMFTVTGVAAKLVEEVFGDLFEEDENMYMLYASYTGMEDIVIDGYAIFVQDEESDEDVLTLGLRGAGVIGAVDFEVEAAFQDQNDGLADDEMFAVNLELGYTLDVAWMPRLFLGGAYIEEDFNRLFSDVQYVVIRDDKDKDLEDAIIIRGGVEVQPTENICAGLEVVYVEEEDGDDERGIEVVLDATYNYSEDLAFTLIYAHDFIDDDWGAGDDYDYVGFISSISF